MSNEATTTQSLGDSQAENEGSEPTSSNVSQRIAELLETSSEVRTAERLMNTMRNQKIQEMTQRDDQRWRDLGFRVNAAQFKRSCLGEHDPGEGVNLADDDDMECNVNSGNVHNHYHGTPPIQPAPQPAPQPQPTVQAGSNEPLATSADQDREPLWFRLIERFGPALLIGGAILLAAKMIPAAKDTYTEIKTSVRGGEQSAPTDIGETDGN